MEIKHKQFKPYDRVLVRLSKEEVWRPHLYGYWDEKNQLHILITHLLIDDDEILPYEGNEHLLGTTNDPEEEIELKEGELLIVFDSYDRLFDYIACTRKFIGVLNTVFETNASNWNLAIRFSDFNPNDMEETRKHILCVKNGKIVRYKE